MSVCVKPADVRLQRAGPGRIERAGDNGGRFSTWIQRTETKLCEARAAIADGAVELDMVLNIGKLCSAENDYVEEEIRRVCEAAHAAGALVKVILENHYLTDAQKVTACALAERAGADFVKTSTGFAASGATIPTWCSCADPVPTRYGSRQPAVSARWMTPLRCGLSAPPGSGPPRPLPFLPRRKKGPRPGRSSCPGSPQAFQRTVVPRCGVSRPVIY